MARTKKDPFSLPGAPTSECYAELVDAARALQAQYGRAFERLELEEPVHLVGFRPEGEDEIAWALLDFDLVSPEGLFALGDPGFEFLDRILRGVEPLRPLDPSTRDRRLLAFAFESAEDVPDEEQARVQAIGRSFHGEESWPVFSAASEYEPIRSPSAEEARRLLGLLRAQTALVRDIAATGAEFLSPSGKAGKDSLLVRRESKTRDGSWSNRRVARPAPRATMNERPIVPSQLVDDLTHTLLKGMPPDPESEIAVDFALASVEAEIRDPDAWNGQRLVTPWLVSVHDRRTGEVLGLPIGDSLESRNHALVDFLVSHMRRTKKRFGAIHVDEPRTQRVLRMFCAEFGIPLRMHPVLTMLEGFRERIAQTYDAFGSLEVPPEERRTVTLAWPGSRLDRLQAALRGLLQYRGVLTHEDAGAWLAEGFGFRLSDPAPLMRDLALLPAGRRMDYVIDEDLVFDPSLDAELADGILEQLEERDNVEARPLTLEQAVSVGAGEPVWRGPEADAFLAGLRADGVDPEDAEAIVASLFALLNRQEANDVVASASERLFWGLPEDTLEAAQGRLKLFFAFYSAVPHWLDKGWSPVQMREGHGTGGRTPATTSAKAGRNDPCPCGSGKKYKNCHGANGA